MCIRDSHLPTPIEYLPSLSSELGINLYIKRDDLTPLAMGGNKLRKLEYFVRDAKDKGATLLLTVGGVQTNHGRLTCAVANKYGLKGSIIAVGQYPGELSANLLLDGIMGSDVWIKNEREGMSESQLYDEAIPLVTQRYEDAGEKVYFIPVSYTHLDVYKRRPVQNIVKHGCFNDELRHSHAAGSHLVFIENNDQLIVFFDIEVLIRFNLFEALFRRPDAAGEEILTLTGFGLFSHLPQNVGANHARIVASFGKQVGKGQHLARCFVQCETAAVLTGTARINGSIKANRQQPFIVAQDIVSCLRSHIPLILL